MPEDRLRDEVETFIALYQNLEREVKRAKDETDAVWERLVSVQDMAFELSDKLEFHIGCRQIDLEELRELLLQVYAMMGKIGDAFDGEAD